MNSTKSASRWPRRWSSRRPRRDDGASLRVSLCIAEPSRRGTASKACTCLGSVRPTESEGNEIKFQDFTPARCRPRARGASFLRLSTGTRAILAGQPAGHRIDDLKTVVATMHQDDRKKRFAAAKLAVRGYAKDPSDNNAARVQAAWKAVSDMETRSSWRQRQEEGILAMRSKWR